MQNDDPAFLAVGTEVSAKFKGAFCEAKIKRISKSARCKVQLKAPSYATLIVDHTDIRGTLELNQPVDVVQGKEVHRAILLGVKDNSIYVVDFDDGDERQLRRTQVFIKGGRHFDEAENLDSLPLYKPETFSAAAIFTKSAKRKEARKRKKLERSSSHVARRFDRRNVDADDDEDVDNMDDEIIASCDDVDSSDESSTSTNSVSNSTTSTVNHRHHMLAGVAAATGDGAVRSLRHQSRAALTTTSSRASSRGAHSSASALILATTSSSKQTDSDYYCNDDYDDDDCELLKRGSKRRENCSRSQKPSASRLIADKILTKSIARTRKKRFAAAAAAAALKRVKESSSSEEGITRNKLSGRKQSADEFSKAFEMNERDRSRSHRKSDRNRYHYSSEEDNQVKGKLNGMSGRRADKKSLKRSKERCDELVTKKKAKDVVDSRAVYTMGTVVAVFEDLSRKGRWNPAVVVSEKACKKFIKESSSGIGNDVFLRSFKDGKFIIRQQNRLSLPGQSALKIPEVISKAALDRATAFVEKGVLPIGWERQQIFADNGIQRKDLPLVAVADNKKRANAAEKGPKQEEKNKSAPSETSSSESSSDEEYGEERDQFTAQLYKFHEERGTPINRAPILGGRDIDMFRLYNVVQQFGGRKRVNDNNLWKLVLRKMHLQGCPGATSATVKHAYLRYLDHFNTFYRSLGISSWLSTSSPSTSARSERPCRLLDRQNVKLRRMKWVVTNAKKKSQEFSATTSKSKLLKREKENDVRIGALKRGRIEANRSKSGELDKTSKPECDIVADVAQTTESSSNLVLNVKSDEKTPSARAAKSKLKIEDEEASSKAGSSDAGILERVKDKKLSQENNEIEKTKIKNVRRADRLKDGNRDETDIDQKKVLADSSKASGRKKAIDKISDLVKQKSPSTVSSVSNADLLSDEEGQMRRSQRKKIASEKARRIREEHSLAKEMDGNKKEKGKESLLPLDKCTSPTILTHFNVAQSIKAYHHGQWYDARIVLVGKETHGDVMSAFMDFEARCRVINDSQQCDGMEKNISLEAASSWLNERLESILSERRCLAHYLGWNARYDEWVDLAMVKVHVNDQIKSEQLFVSKVAGHLSSPTLEVAVAWRSSVNVNACLTDSKSKSARVRRLSQAQEQVSSAAGSVSRSRSRSTTFSEKGLKKSIVPSESSISSFNFHCDQKVNVELINETVSASTEFNKPDVPNVDLELKEEFPQSTPQEKFVIVPEVLDCEPVRISYESVHSPIVQIESSAEISIPSMEPVRCVSQFIAAPIISSALETDDKLITKQEDDAGGENSTSVKLLINELVSNSASSVDAELLSAESVVVSSIGGAKCDTVNTSLAHVDFEETGFRAPVAISPKIEQQEVGELNTRKKRSSNRSGLASSDRKGGIVKSRKGNIDECKESDGETSTDSESVTSVRDSWHALKQRMQQKIEAENGWDTALSSLSLEPLDQNITGDALITKLQDRLQELREIYHTVRSDQARLDRRWRKTVERRRQRDKEIRKREESCSQQSVVETALLSNCNSSSSPSS